MLGNSVGGAIDLTAHRKELHSICIFVFCGEVVENVAVCGVGSNLPSAQADRRNGVGVHRPVADVDVMNVLLADMVAREPGEIEPVSELPFHIGPFRLTRVHPESALIPVGIASRDFAHLAVVDSFHGFAVGDVVASLCSGDDAQILGFCKVSGFENGTDSGCIGGNRLFHEYVLAGFDGGF